MPSSPTASARSSSSSADRSGPHKPREQFRRTLSPKISRDCCWPFCWGYACSHALSLNEVCSKASHGQRLLFLAECLERLAPRG